MFNVFICGNISNTEHMDNVTNTNIEMCPCTLEQRKNKIFDEFIGYDKYLNLKTKFNDKDYYLASVPKSLCKNNDGGCTNNILVLMDTDVVNSYIKESNDFYSEKINVCNYEKKIQCEFDANKNKIPLDTCAKNYDECDYKKNYIHNFTMTTGGDNNQLYYLAGIPNANTNIDPLKYLVNTIPDNDGNLKICVDGLPATTFFYVTIELKEFVDNSNTVKFKIGLKKQYTGLNPDQTPIIKNMYLGKCDDKCEIDGKEIFNTCLYDNIDDPNVLSFDFVHYNL